jgi:hypothetical protein
MFMLKTILLTFTWLVFFEGKTPTPLPPRPNSDETLKCSLPAPKNLHLTSIGTTSAFFEWDPVPGAAYYRIKVFNFPSYTMIYSRLVTALPKKNGVVVNGLGGGTSFDVEVRSVCSNGVESPKPN